MKNSENMDNTPILKRPKPTDSEEELFRMQEEFLKNKQQPSAKVINLRESSSTTETAKDQINIGKVRSKFSQQKRLKTQDRVSTSQVGGDVINPVIKEKGGPQEYVQNIPISSCNIILGNIVEKKYDKSNYECNKQQSFQLDSGFPQVFSSPHMVLILFYETSCKLINNFCFTFKILSL